MHYPRSLLPPSGEGRRPGGFGARVAARARRHL